MECLLLTHPGKWSVVQKQMGNTHIGSLERIQPGSSELCKMGSQFYPYVVRNLNAWALEPQRTEIKPQLCAWQLGNPGEVFKPLWASVFSSTKWKSWYRVKWDCRAGSQPRDTQDADLTSLRLKAQPVPPVSVSSVRFFFFFWRGGRESSISNYLKQ